MNLIIMKKNLLLFFVFSLLSFFIFGKPVSIDKAEVVAKNIYYERASLNYNIDYQSLSLELTHTEFSGETATYYIFNTISKPEGYVIISADDDAFPVIAYSFEGNFNKEKQSPELLDWLINREKEIAWIIEKKLQADKTINDEWKRLSIQPILRGFRAVSPLITSKWGQGKYYNRDCPQDAASSQDGRTLVGCVAIAMGQIMRYHQKPITGSGSYSYYHNVYGTQSANFGMTNYNWAGMPNTLSTYNSSVATLLYHCGVSVEMNYGVSGSSAYPSDAATALQNYFGYGSSISKKEKNNYTSSAWESMLKSDIDNALPLLYYGYGSSGGHAFICDGYQGTSNNHFHFNWGWDGYLDGYFYVSSLNPGTMDFSNNQGAIFGIKPGIVSGAIISLVAAIDVIPDTFTQYDNAEVWVKLANKSSVDFTGDYRCAIYSTSGQYVELIDTYNNVTLPKGYQYTNGFSFYKSSVNCNPGTYMIVIEYKPSGGNWTLVDKQTYTHPVNVIVKAGSSGLDMRMYGAFLLTPTTFIQGDSVDVWVDVANYSSTSFYGDYTVSLFDASTGQFVETIETITNASLGSMKHYTNGLTFESNKIMADPGDYLIAIHYKPSGGSWYLLSEGSYNNPVSVKVISKSLNPDIYEVNNSESTPFTFSPSFAGDSSVILTTGSNIHNATDVDYYKVSLATGYDYKIKLRLHDSYNSGDGNQYSVDGVFAYKYGANWSAYFDDADANEFTVTNGGTVIFEVSPFFEGALGSYLFDIRIKRVQPGKPDLIIIDESVNPANIVAGSQVTAICTVKNIGNINSGSSILKYYLSQNNTYDVGDQDMGTDNIINLSKDGSVSAGEVITIPIGTTAGKWYILFLADATNSIDEDNEVNNIASQEINISKPAPDLIIYSKSATPNPVEKGSVLSVNCTIKNQGQGDANASVIKYYLSLNSSLDGSDLELASDNILSLTAGNTSSSGENLIIPTSFPTGNAYIIIEADATKLISEADETNNIDNIPIIINSNVSVPALNDNNNVTIYPNPNQGSFFIKFLKDDNYSIKITDMLGNIVFSLNTNQSDNFINLQCLNGIYLLIIESHDFNYCTKMIITK